MTWPNDRDHEVFNLIDREVERQNSGLQLIASENFTSPAVMEAVGSVLTFVAIVAGCLAAFRYQMWRLERTT